MTADRRVDQIIEVATKLIGERGFWGISVQDVADACGLTTAGLLHHVHTKDGLLIAVLEHRDAADMDALAGLLDTTVDDIVGFRLEITPQEFCRALVQRNAGQPEIVRLYTVLNGESLAPEHPAHEYFVERERLALEYFTDMVRGHVDDPEEVGRQLLAAMDGLQLRWLRAPNDVDLVGSWDRLANVLLGQLDR